VLYRLKFASFYGTCRPLHPTPEKLSGRKSGSRGALNCVEGFQSRLQLTFVLFRRSDLQENIRTPSSRASAFHTLKRWCLTRASSAKRFTWSGLLNVCSSSKAFTRPSCKRPTARFPCTNALSNLSSVQVETCSKSHQRRKLAALRIRVADGEALRLSLKTPVTPELENELFERLGRPTRHAHRAADDP
jgi:hypothetical protein